MSTLINVQRNTGSANRAVLGGRVSIGAGSGDISSNDMSSYQSYQSSKSIPGGA